MSIFEGAGVALVTPFHEDGSVNYEKLEQIVEEQIAGGTDCIIACGTTGEAATLSHEEHIEVIRFVAESPCKQSASGYRELLAAAVLSLHGDNVRALDLLPEVRRGKAALVPCLRPLCGNYLGIYQLDDPVLVVHVDNDHSAEHPDLHGCKTRAVL